MSSSDIDLQLKKRARRRLLGAVAFAGLAAVVLPMVMDEEPKQQIQELQIRIPSQDQPPLKSARLSPPSEPAPDAPPPSPEEMPSAVPAEKPQQSPVEKKAEKLPAAPKPVEKPPVEKLPVEKPPEKLVGKPSNNESEAQRAAAILAGKTTETRPSATAEGKGQFIIQIGAFTNPANVKQLQTKIGEMGIKVFTEPLESAGVTKTRVRAGPFPSREAAEKALEKIKRIGVNGVIAAK